MNALRQKNVWLTFLTFDIFMILHALPSALGLLTGTMTIKHSSKHV